MSDTDPQSHPSQQDDDLLDGTSQEGRQPTGRSGNAGRGGSEARNSGAQKSSRRERSSERSSGQGRRQRSNKRQDNRDNPTNAKLADGNVHLWHLFGRRHSRNDVVGRNSGRNSQADSAPRSLADRTIPLVAWLSRLLALVLLAACPWPYAMANWSAQVYLIPTVGFIFLGALAVAVTRRINVANPLSWSLLVLLGISLLQVLPLPSGIWSILSASAPFDAMLAETVATFADVPAADGSTRAASGSPTTISIHPLQTRASFVVLALGVAFLLSCNVLFRSRQQVYALFGVLAASGFANAGLGIYQSVVAGNWTLLDGMLPTSFATFVGRNSAPQYIVCCLAAASALLWAYRTLRKQMDQDQRYQISYPSVNPLARIRRRVEDFVSDIDPGSTILLLLIIVLAAGILVANSRGGTLASAAAVLMTAVVFAVGKQMNVSGAVALLFIVVCCGGFLMAFQLDDAIGQRLETISAEAYLRDNARIELWQMALSQAAAWKLGHGLGTFHLAILPEYPSPLNVWFYHAENIYIEVLSNCGILGLLAMLVGLGWLMWQLLVKSPHSDVGKAARLACLMALVAVSLHGLVDFSLMLPSVFLPLAALIGAFLGTRHRVQPKRTSRHGLTEPDDDPSSRKRRSRHLESPTNQGPVASGEDDVTGTDESPARPMTKSDYLKLAAGRGPARSGAGGNDHHGSPGAAQADASLLAEHSSRRKLLALAAFAITITTAVLLGQDALRSYAMASQLETASNRLTDARRALKAAPKIRQAAMGKAVEERQAEFQALVEQYKNTGRPEVEFWVSRWSQEEASTAIEESESWPDEITEAMREKLSHPEFFTAAFIADEESDLAPLKAELLKMQGELEDLQSTRAGMQSALSVSAWDGRASWGLLRSDLGQLSRSERLRNYARIWHTCRNSLRVLQATATHAVLVGETSFGLEVWRQLLTTSPAARVSVVRLLDRGINLEQLISILPADPLPQIYIARRLQAEKRPEEAAAIVSQVAFEAAYQQASSLRDWRDVVWAAKLSADDDHVVEALQEATRANGLDADLWYQLAQAYLQVGDFSSAATSIRAARERDKASKLYYDLELEIDRRARGL